MKLYKSLGQALRSKEEVQALKLKLDSFDPQLFNFPNLKELYLEGDCSKLPQDLSGFNQLGVLSIKWPSFKGDLSALFNLPLLRNLKIIETPMPFFYLPLGQVVAPLEILSIKNCGLEKLPAEIEMLSSLKELALPENKLIELPPTFPLLKKLTRLNLDKNEFKVFPDVIKKSPQLSHLSIDHNLFSEEERERIQREFNIWPN
jgi:leucine-rich repeat protein SHOC2